jgi:hypothetical protein
MVPRIYDIAGLLSLQQLIEKVGFNNVTDKPAALKMMRDVCESILEFSGRKQS